MASLPVDVQFWSTPQTGLTQPADTANVAFLADAASAFPRRAVAFYKNMGKVDARTTTTETIALASRGKLVTLNNAGAIAVTLDSTVTSDFLCAVDCVGAGTATLTPSSGTINGSATLVLTTGQSCWLFWTGVTWWALLGAGSGGASVAGVQNEQYTYANDTGAANAYVVTLSPAPSSYTAGLDVAFLAANANSGASTLNVNGLGTKNIKKWSSGSLIALASGDISTGQIMRVKYDGTQFQILSGSGGFTAGGDLAANSSVSQEVIGILNTLFDSPGTAWADGQTIEYNSGLGKLTRLVDRPIFIISAVPSLPLSGQLVAIYTAATTMTFPVNFATPNSYGSLGTNPTATATYTIYKNGVSVGTIVISTSGVFTFTTSGFSLNANDRLVITAPGTQDATLSDVSFTLVGTRAATIPATATTGIFIWRGAYNNATAYNVNDVVSYFGNVYICVSPSTGNLPTNATFWALVIQNQYGGAITLDYLFSTTTTNADPGSRFLRLNNATMSSSTAAYINLTDFNGSGMTAVLDALDVSTNTNKAQFRFTKKGDVTKWLIFYMTARISHTGYREYTISNIASSTASPFSNNDELLVEVSIIGDQGSGVTIAQVQNETYTYAADGGTANAYVVTLASAPASYTAGLVVMMKAANTNTGASTINVNGLGTKNIKKIQGGSIVSLAGSEIQANQTIPLVYDGTQFQLAGGAGGGDTTATYVVGDVTVPSDLTNARRYPALIAGPDIPPATANAMDDEFDDATWNTNGLWTWVNQGGASAVDTKSRLHLGAPSAGGSHNVHLIHQPLPSPPWEFVIRMNINCFGQFGGGGLFLYESATGKAETIYIQQNAPWTLYWIRQFTTLTTNPTDVNTLSLAPSFVYGMYLKVARSGTTLTYSVSDISDGLDFLAVYSHAINAWFTTAPDKVGIGVNPFSQQTDLYVDYFRRTV